MGHALGLACRQRLAWQADGLDPVVTLNVSPRELRRPDFAERLLERIARHGLDPSRMIAEITETAAMSQSVRTEPLMGMSDAMRAQHLELKQFLREQVYRHQRVLRMTTKAKRVVSALFSAFMDEIKLMPAEHRDTAARTEQRDGASGRARIVADYIAGMTDRYAILEYQRLFDPAERT